MKPIITLITCLSLVTQLSAQQTEQSSASSKPSPYKTSWKVDGPVIAGTIGLNVLGLNLIQNKKSLTEAQLEAKSKADINAIDRFSAGYYSENADKLSYYPFYGSFAAPVVLLLNKNIGGKAGQVLALYLETMAVTGAAYTLSAGSINRSRPYTYGTKAPLEQRMKTSAQRSFFGGHTAATASASFFAAKIFADFNPDSRAKPYVWAAAAAVPALVGYYRLRGGMHFLSDNLVGYAVGAGAGILIPQLHKKTDNSDLSLTPVTGLNYQGLSLIYQLH